MRSPNVRIGTEILRRLHQNFLWSDRQIGVIFSSLQRWDRGEMPIAADQFRAMAARCRERANETTEPGLRDAYWRLMLEYTGLALQREAVEGRHTLIGRFDAEKSKANGRAMNTVAFRARLGVLGLSVRSFAAMTGVQYETARHWGGMRSGRSQEFPRWVPLMLEMMDSTVCQRPPDDAVNRPRPRSDDHGWQ
jgi:hypothetical protein